MKNKRQVEWNKIALLTRNYTQMAKLKNDKENPMFKHFTHLVANGMKEIAGLDLERPRKSYSKKEKARIDAISILFMKCYLDGFKKEQLINEFKEIGYEVLNDDLHNSSK